MVVVHPFFLSSIFVASLFWTALYFIVRMFTRKQPAEYTNRIVTLCHGSILTVWGSRECFVDGWIFSYPDISVKCTQEFALLSSLGYFIFDLLWCLYYKTETNLMIGHHVYSIFALCRLLVKRHHWGHVGCALGGMEATNPLLQIRWFIRSYGYSNSQLFIVVDCVFIIVFIILRIIVGTVIMWYVLSDQKFDREFQFLAILIYLVSWAFVVNMYNYMNKKYFLKQIDLAEEASPVSGSQ